MFPIRDTKIKEFCKDVADVDYISYTLDWKSIKHDLTSEQQYIELELLFGFNDLAKSTGQEPYIQVLTDYSGKTYALLSEEGTKYAFSHDLSFMPEYKDRDRRNVSLDKAMSKYVDNSLEDRICEKCGNVLGVDCSKHDYLELMKSYINKGQKRFTKKGPIAYNGKGSPWAGVFLALKDIPGTYMN